MFCSECGKQIADDSSFCAYCGSKIPAVLSGEAQETNEPKLSESDLSKEAELVNEEAISIAQNNLQSKKKPSLPIKLCVLFAVIAIGIIAAIVIKKAVDRNKASSYASSYSSSSYSSSSSSTMDAYAYAMLYLKVSDITITHNSLYTVCTGTIKNTGSYRISFVKIRGAFKNRIGETLDTDWTYAVGSEGLRPGESTTFRMSVSKNTSITKCEISFLSY